MKATTLYQPQHQKQCALNGTTVFTSDLLSADLSEVATSNGTTTFGGVRSGTSRGPSRNIAAALNSSSARTDVSTPHDAATPAETSADELLEASCDVSRSTRTERVTSARGIIFASPGHFWRPLDLQSFVDFDNATSGFLQPIRASTCQSPSIRRAPNEEEIGDLDCGNASVGVGDPRVPWCGSIYIQPGATDNVKRAARSQTYYSAQSQGLRNKEVAENEVGDIEVRADDRENRFRHC